MAKHSTHYGTDKFHSLSTTWTHPRWALPTSTVSGLNNLLVFSIRNRHGDTFPPSVFPQKCTRQILHQLKIRGHVHHVNCAHFASGVKKSNYYLRASRKRWKFMINGFACLSVGSWPLNYLQLSGVLWSMTTRYSLDDHHENMYLSAQICIRMLAIRIGKKILTNFTPSSRLRPSFDAIHYKFEKERDIKAPSKYIFFLLVPSLLEKNFSFHTYINDFTFTTCWL